VYANTAASTSYASNRVQVYFKFFFTHFTNHTVRNYLPRLKVAAILLRQLKAYFLWRHGRKISIF